MSFEKLMSELTQLQTDQESLAKALPADDGKDEAKIQAAAAEGGLGDGDADDMGGAPDGDADDASVAKGKPMAKSFQLTLEDGTTVDAQDGTEMVKALQDQITATETTMAKALGQAVDLIKGQGEMIKSLSERIAKLSGEGRGRKAVLSVVERPSPDASTATMAKSHAQPSGVTPDAFFAKALVAQREGRISGSDIALAETMLNRGQQIPAEIVQRVMA